MKNEEKNAVNWLSDRCFEIFYIMLFLLQIPPTISILLFGIWNVWTLVAYAISLAAMITQAIKFPCFQNMIWRAGMCGSVILAAMYSEYGEVIVERVAEVAGKIVGA